jgi:type I restriction enzyme S subunit
MRRLKRVWGLLGMSFDRCSNKVLLNLSNWEEMDIVDVCDSIVDCVNKTAPTVEYTTIYKMIRTTNVKKGNIDLVSVKYVSEDVYKVWTRRSIPQIGDVILTREAPIGEVGIVKTEEKIFLGQRLIQFRANKKILNSRFLLYSMKAPFMQKQIQSYEGTGSTVSHIRVPDCLKFKIKVPDLYIQNNISHILGSLDEKIELNNRMNKVLEQMAQVIFKQWFVDFEFPNENGEPYKSSGGEMKWCEELGKEIPMGWDVKSIGNVVNIKHGYAFKSESFSEMKSELILLTPGNVKIGGGFNYSKFKYYKTEEDVSDEYILREGEIIITMTDLSKDGDTLGYPALVPEILGSKFLHNQRLGKTVFTTQIPIKMFLYFLLRTNEYRQHVLATATGTTVKHTAPKRIMEYKFTCPTTDIINSFDEISQECIEKINNNTKANHRLSLLMDTLLPKLMSGEIDVSEVEL